MRVGGTFTSHFRLWGCCQDFLQGTTSRRYPLQNSHANRHGGIYDLPNELILHIVSYIKNHSTLHNLSLVSIAFKGIGTASLYHTYKNRESEETNALLDGLSLRSFLRLILTNSRLASLVKKSIWDYGRLGSMSSPFILSFTLAGPPSPEDLKLFLDCSQGLELEIPGGE